MNFPFQPQGVSTILTTGAASAATALPLGGDDKPFRYMRFLATGRCTIQLAGHSGVTVTANNGIRLAAGVPEIICTAGQTHIAIIDGADAGVVISMTPIELAVPR